MKEYKISKIKTLTRNIKITFMFLCTTAIIIIYLFNPKLFKADPFNLIFLPLSFIISILIIIETYKSRLIIGEESIIYIGIISKNELKFEEIEGYFVNSKSIFIETNNDDKNRIRVSNTFEGYSEILNWLSERYPDLDN